MVSEEKLPFVEAEICRAVRRRVRRPLRIALFGFGTVGSSVARILVESKPKGWS